jgi:hypothetical protein
VLLEETVELVGAMLLLAAVLSYHAAVFQRRAAPDAD